jgi:hypothetical protein
MKAQELWVKYSPVHWLVLMTAVVALAFVFVSLEALIAAGSRILPFGTVLHKTVLLFQGLKIALPTLGGHCMISNTHTRSW